MTVSTAQYKRDVCCVEEGTQLSFSGRITDMETKSQGYRYRMAVTAFNDTGIRVYVLLDYGELLAIGTQVQGQGIVKNFEGASNPGGYDEYNYQQGKNNVLLLTDITVWKQSQKGLSVKAVLYAIRNRVADVYGKLYSQADASLACAMVLGERTNLDKDIKQLYQRNGIAHLIAISGLHIAMLGGTLYRFLRKRLGSYPVAAVLGVIFILLYGTMAGLTGATLRAVVMLMVSIGADVTGRKYDGISAMALALFFMLLENPYQMNQAGFLLSFGAVIGIAVICPVFQLWFEHKPKWLDGLCVSVSVQLIITPVLLYYFYEIPLYSIFLNLIVVPLMSVLLFLLILSAVSGCVSSILGGIPAKFAQVIFWIYKMLCEYCEKLPFHTLCTGRPSVIWIVVYYVILAVLVIAGYQKKRKTGIVLFCMLIGLFAIFYLPGQMKICMFDVGQGDGIYIKTPNRKHILIDGGSSSKQKVGTYVLKNGVKYYGGAVLDYVFVTHSDSDHYSGIVELLEEPSIQIRHFVLPAIANPDESYEQLVAMANQHGCEVLYMQEGDYIMLGRVSFTCFHPHYEVYEDKNRGSLVLYMQYKAFDMLFTGDMDEVVEKELVEILPEEICVLKIPHHGSATASSEEFLKRIRFRTALVSVGETNRYGHPAKEVMERLYRYCDDIYLTKDSGGITIDSNGTTYRVTTVK